MKKISLTILIISVIGLIGWRLFHQKNSPDQTVVMKSKTIVESINEKGRIQSKNEWIIMAKSNGVIQSIPIKEGDWVNAGTSLLIMNSSLSFEKLKEMRQQSSIKQIEYERASQNLTIQQKLFSVGSISKSDLENAEQQLQLAKAQLQMSQSQIESVKLDIQNQLYSAPSTTQVAKIAVKQGDVVMANQLLIQLIDPNQLKVDIYVKEFDAPLIKKGQMAWVTLPSNRRMRIRAEVTNIQPILEKNGESYSMKVTVSLQSPSNQEIGLKPGTQVDVQIIVGQVENAMSLPINAVTFENGYYYVQVKKDGGILKRRVEVGLQNAMDIEIKSGLNSKDKVLIL